MTVSAFITQYPRRHRAQKRANAAAAAEKRLAAKPLAKGKTLVKPLAKGKTTSSSSSSSVTPHDTCSHTLA